MRARQHSGGLAKTGIDRHRGLVFLTSRASYELVRKTTARMNIGTLATTSAPTELAIRLAHAAGIQRLSLCRENGCVAYPASDEPGLSQRSVARMQRSGIRGTGT